MRLALALGVAAGLLRINTAYGQTAGAEMAAATAPPAWSLYPSAYAYFVPEERDYVAPTCTADRGWLHLEARYNYEDLEAGSLFLGANYGTGESMTLEFTPMLGAVFGRTTGLVPGYRLTLGYGALELYSEAEFVVDANDTANNFFYSWSELSYALGASCRIGLAGQRTKVYQTELEVQRGLLAGFTYKKVDCTGILFNLGWSSPMIVLSAGYQL